VSVDFLITRFFSNLTGSDWVNPYKIRQKNIYIHIYCIYKFQKSVANLNQRYVALQEGRFLLPLLEETQAAIGPRDEILHRGLAKALCRSRLRSQTETSDVIAN